MRRWGGPLTLRDVVDMTRMPYANVKTALGRLHERGVIEVSGILPSAVTGGKEGKIYVVKE
jgi:hypothetical protein